jgi:hypothetical protein
MLSLFLAILICVFFFHQRASFMAKKTKRGVTINVPTAVFMPSGLLNIVDRPTDKAAKRKLDSYCAKLGQLVYAWNQLQDHLSELFWAVTGITNGAIPLSIWNSVQSDRSQRHMLRVAAQARADAALDKFPHSTLGKEIIWLLCEVDKLANQRNNIVHSPYILVTWPAPMRLIPVTFRGNRLAKNLKNKDLLNEFRWGTATAVALAIYTRQLTRCIRAALAPLPDRPRLPNRGEKSRQKRATRRSRPQPRRRPSPPRSSSA